MRKTLEMTALNALSYFILTVDLRAVAQGNLAWSFWSNVIIAALSFSILKRISQADSIGERIGYVVGGSTATVIGILFTQKVIPH